jgi:hypothetical protein
MTTATEPRTQLPTFHTFRELGSWYKQFCVIHGKPVSGRARGGPARKAQARPSTEGQTSRPVSKPARAPRAPRPYRPGGR